MDWDELVETTLARPGMWVPRPYLQGLLTLWRGFALGARDSSLQRFETWLRAERYPAPGGTKSPLVSEALIQRAAVGNLDGILSNGEDDRCVELLAELLAAHRATLSRD